MKQWILIGAGIVLLVVYSLLGGHAETASGNEVAKSDRVLLDRVWRAKPEREITIGEMEQYAAGLSDDDLWTEIEVSCEKWMAVNGMREFKIPPRLAVMLAREMGRRQGEAGVWKIANFLKEKELRWDFDEEVSERGQLLRFLRENLNYASFLHRVTFEVWSDDVVEKVVKLDEGAMREWQRGKLLELLARARPSRVAEIIVHSEASAELRKTLVFTTALYGTQYLHLMNEEEIPFLIRGVTGMSAGYRFGPIDGRDGGWIPNWEEHHRTMAEVVEDSDWDVGEKRKYLGRIEESRGRLDE